MITRVYLKRLFFISVVIALIVSARLYDNGLCSLVRKAGEFSYFDDYDNQIYISQPLFCSSYQRLDLPASTTVDELLSSAYATLVFCEEVQETAVVYAYSPFIYRFVTVRGEKVNLMIAVKSDAVVVGSPIIKGSY